jgi:hypothetical protein
LAEVTKVEPVQARYIHEVGTRCTLRIYWTGNCVINGSDRGYHNAEKGDQKTSNLRDWHFGGEISDRKPYEWADRCHECGTFAPPFAIRQIFYTRLWDTQSGQPEPGDLFFDDTMHHEGHCLIWNNCDKPHLNGVIPTGEWWDADSRARNCTLPDDKTHRCWIRHGEPPLVTVDKNGYTCTAGSGSIQTARWHGFLRDGKFVT